MHSRVLHFARSMARPSDWEQNGEGVTTCVRKHCHGNHQLLWQPSDVMETLISKYSKTCNLGY